MRRVLLFLLLATACFGQTTPNLNLNLPPHASLGWDTKINANMTLLDNYLSGASSIPSLKVTGCITLNGGAGLLCGNALNLGAVQLSTTGLTLGNNSLGTDGAISNSGGFSVDSSGNVDATGYKVGGETLNFHDLAGSATGSQLPNPAVGALGGVRAITCTGSQKISAIGTDGIPVCSADQTTAGGSGITSLNGATGSVQTFVNGANITISTNTGTGAHTIAVSGLATVATSGAYSDLTGKPTLPANTTATGTQYFTAYNSTTGAFTKAQPAYSDLTGAPSIPSTSDWPNAGACAANNFVTALVDGSAPTCARPSSANLSDADAVQTRQFTYRQGCDQCSAIADTDDESDVFPNKLGRTITIQSVFCKTDAGTPTIMLSNGVNNILAGNLTCTTSGASTTSFNGTYNQIANNGIVNYQTVVAGGSAKRITLVVVYK